MKNQTHKTVTEHLEELPEPFRMKAYDNHRTKTLRSSDHLTANNHYAINDAFDWGNTKEGNEYWFLLFSTMGGFYNREWKHLENT